MLTDMSINVTPVEGASTRIDLEGRVDVLAAPELRATLQDLLDQGHTHFDVHFQNVNFMDSAGIAAVVNLVTRCKRAGGDVILHGPVSSVVHRIFDLTGFARVFTVESWTIQED